VAGKKVMKPGGRGLANLRSVNPFPATGRRRMGEMVLNYERRQKIEKGGRSREKERFRCP